MWIFLDSCQLNLLFVQSYLAEKIIVKRPIQEHNNVTGVRVEPGWCNQGPCENDIFNLLATLPTFQLKGGLNQKLNLLVQELSNLGGMLNKLMQLKRIHRRRSQSPGDFSDFSKNNNLFNSIWITFCTILEPFERTKLVKFKSRLKESNCLAPSAPLS